MKFLTFLCALILTACTPALVPDTRAADEAAIRKLDADWVRAGQMKNVDAWVAFYADDAAVLPPNDRLATSKESIRKAVADLLATPDIALTWQPARVEVARSGDLAYLYAAYQMTYTDEKGKPGLDRGKNLEVWKKQPDGNWKCVADTWNSDLPAAPAPSVR